jgi:hypothetical protein
MRYLSSDLDKIKNVACTEFECGNYLIIKHLVTADMDDGQPLPPLIENGIVWCVVRRAHGLTLWRRIFLKESSAMAIHARRRRARECF